MLKNALKLLKRQLHAKSVEVPEWLPNSFELSSSFNGRAEYARDVATSMSVYENFLSVDEEQSILNEIEPYLKTLRYEYDHWDDAIHGYRETERLHWNDDNVKILDRVRSLAFPPSVTPLQYVHILDIDRKGYIKPHIDSERFCGDTIAGLSLLSDCVMRLVRDDEKELHVNVLLRRRSLYIMKSVARYKYTHEILKSDCSLFKDEEVRRERRISVICRNSP
uniref:Alpha-ketoglutarate-dependent dioxygenase AlkB-like domain-containing protein n=1 Tax=Photinus pyralis TaxID=7054 RepID=A0A1Y1KRG6_PHOPY